MRQRESGLPERAGIQQRVLPAYRGPFFDSLARALPGRLSVFAGLPRPGEAIPQAVSLEAAKWYWAGNRYWGRGKLSAIWQSGWREWLTAEDPQLLIFEAHPRLLSNRAILRWMGERGRTVIGWSLGPVRDGKDLFGWIRSFYRQFSALIVYSQTAAEAFQRLGMPAEKIFVAPNSVESSLADALLRLPRGRIKARTELGLDERPVVLSVGRLVSQKRVDALLRACARLGDACQLLIVGDGPDRVRLESLAAGTFPAARFTGDLRGEALGKCFLAGDFFVMPGTGGLALQEAMQYGKTVAAAEADGSQRDLIHEGENGWMLPAGDEDALLRVMREALGDPRRLKRMGAASRKIVRETATMEKMVAGFLRAIRFALADRGRGS
jgi:glycosyltransferase involved in cell wall biosynthesis